MLILSLQVVVLKVEGLLVGSVVAVVRDTHVVAAVAVVLAVVPDVPGVVATLDVVAVVVVLAVVAVVLAVVAVVLAVVPDVPDVVAALVVVAVVLAVVPDVPDVVAALVVVAVVLAVVPDTHVVAVAALVVVVDSVHHNSGRPFELHFDQSSKEARSNHVPLSPFPSLHLFLIQPHPNLFLSLLPFAASTRGHPQALDTSAASPCPSSEAQESSRPICRPHGS